MTMLEVPKCLTCLALSDLESVLISSSVTGVASSARAPHKAKVDGKASEGVSGCHVVGMRTAALGALGVLVTVVVALLVFVIMSALRPVPRLPRSRSIRGLDGLSRNRRGR